MDQLQECDTDTKEHVDWDGSAWHVFEDEDEVEPGEEHSEGSYLPLASGRTPALVVKAMDEDKS